MDDKLIIVLTQLCWAIPVAKNASKNEVMMTEPWSKHLTRLSEESKKLQNKISSMFDEKCTTPKLPYKPGKLSKGPKDSMNNLPASDEITFWQILTNLLVNDIDTVLKVHGVKSLQGGIHKKLKGLPDPFQKYFTTLQDFNSFLKNVLSIFNLE